MRMLVNCFSRLNGLGRRGHGPGHDLLQRRAEEGHKLGCETMFDSRRRDVEPQLCGRGLEVGDLGIGLSEQSQDEHLQQAGPGEFANTLDSTCGLPEFVELGAEDLLHGCGDLAYDLHWEAPSSSTERDTTRDGIGASRFSC